MKTRQIWKCLMYICMKRYQNIGWSLCVLSLKYSTIIHPIEKLRLWPCLTKFMEDSKRYWWNMALVECYHGYCSIEWLTSLSACVQKKFRQKESFNQQPAAENLGIWYLHFEAETKWPPFREDIFKYISLNVNVWISINISLMFVPTVRSMIFQQWFR